MAAKRKKKKQTNAAGLALFVIVMLLIAFGAWLIFKEPETENKASKFWGYPTKYEEYVISYSAEFDIDPRFIFAIIRTESHFNPNAESDVGARGLMQIMPDAYEWICFRLNDEETESFDDMYDPEQNIRYGTYMLSYLYETFGSYELAAGAYHQGMNAVQSWIDDGTIDPEHFSVDENLSDMPSELTQDYITKVMNAFEKYKDNSELEKDINNSQ
jgi:soluble lytic murein transglycosylase